MDIDSLTVRDLKDIAGLLRLGDPAQSPWEIGEAYLIRTVTMIDTGRLVAVTEHELVLEDAAWIADTGRFANCLKTGDFVEVEPFPEGRVIVGRGAVVDACKLSAPLPRVQK
jgi:hypothetical protein